MKYCNIVNFNTSIWLGQIKWAKRKEEERKRRKKKRKKEKKKKKKRKNKLISTNSLSPALPFKVSLVYLILEHQYWYLNDTKDIF